MDRVSATSKIKRSCDKEGCVRHSKISLMEVLLQEVGRNEILCEKQGLSWCLDCLFRCESSEVWLLWLISSKTREDELFFSSLLDLYVRCSGEDTRKHVQSAEH